MTSSRRTIAAGALLASAAARAACRDPEAIHAETGLDAGDAVFLGSR